MHPWKTEKSQNQWGRKRPLGWSGPAHGPAVAEHCMVWDRSHHTPAWPSSAHAGRSNGSPHIPIMSKHFWPQGAIRDFSRYPPNILQQEILQQKKNSLATFPEYSHFGPSRNAAGTTLLRERWVFVSWLEHRVRGQELWVLIPALPLNHFESFASHFVLEPVRNFPLGWFSDGKHCLYQTEIWVKIDFSVGNTLCLGWLRKDIRPKLQCLGVSSLVQMFCFE